MAWAQYLEEVPSGQGEHLLPVFGLSGILCSASLPLQLQALPEEVVWALVLWTPSNSAP